MSSPARYKPLAQAPAKQEEAPSIATLIKQLEPELARALPKHLNADRIARLALTVVRKNPKLASCTPESFAGALLTAAGLGLEPGLNNEAHLVPYWDSKRKIMECQLIVGYQGVTKHYWQSPLACHLDSHAVYQGDEFDFAYGLEPSLHHIPCRSGYRGEVTDYYATARLTTGATAFVVLSPEEVAELRRGKVGPNGDIPDPQHWMEKKTAVKQLLKLLPKSTTLQQVLDADERNGADLYRSRLADRGIVDVEPLPDPGPPTTIAAESVEETPMQGQAPALPVQLKKLNILIGKESVGGKPIGSNRDAKLAYLESQFKRPFTSSSELTRLEAAQLTEYLEKQQARDVQQVQELAATEEQPAAEQSDAEQSTATLQALLNRLGELEVPKDDRLALLTGILGRDITAYPDLTDIDRGRALDRLVGLGPDDDAAALVERIKADAEPVAKQQPVGEGEAQS